MLLFFGCSVVSLFFLWSCIAWLQHISTTIHGCTADGQGRCARFLLPISPPLSFSLFLPPHTLFTLLYNKFWREFSNSGRLLAPPLTGQRRGKKQQQQRKKRGAAMLVVAAGVEEYNMRKKKESCHFYLSQREIESRWWSPAKWVKRRIHTHTKCATITSCVLLFFETRKKTNAFLTLSRTLYVSRGNKKE